MASFLHASRRRIESGSAGDRAGGSAGSDGSGLPSGRPGEFLFATGIECSAPMTANGRRDLLEECGHYARYAEDLALVRELGLKYLRYGLPYHRTHLGPGRYDWSFADVALAELRRLEIVPILDLLHFGLPDWLGDFQNPEFPLHFADYCDAVAQRYPWVRFYTLINEIFVCAKFSALQGIWNERQKSDRAFVTAIKHLCAASILGAQAIARHRPDMIIVQSETAEKATDMRASPDPRVALENGFRFLALDLLYGQAPEANVLLCLFENGLTRDEFDWFMRGKPPGYQIMGIDYYGRNESMILPDGTVLRAEDLNGWYGITKHYFYRYQRPTMYTETNVFDADAAPRWLWKQFANVLRMRGDNIPVLGFTWYSLIDQIDWDTGLSEHNGRVQACGLYDLDRRPRPVADAYRQLIREFGQMALIPRAEVLSLSGEPARLRMER